MDNLVILSIYYYIVQIQERVFIRPKIVARLTG